MQGRSRTAIVLLTLTIMIIIIVMLSTAIFAATGNTISGSSNIKYLNHAQQVAEAHRQQEELVGTADNPTGLNAEVNEENGTITMKLTEPWGNLSSDDIIAEHNNLIKTGILRYAIYEGTICKAVRDQGLMLIVILDFSKYNNITTFGAGFLNGLAYVLLGSHSAFGAGASFVEKNFEYTDDQGTTHPKAFAIYDSTNGGAEKYTQEGERMELHLTGIYSQTGLIKPQNSYLLNTKDNKQTPINQYSVRIILPNTPNVTLETDSLKIKGVGGDSFSIISPAGVALGISHLGLLSTGLADDGSIAWNKTIDIQPKVVGDKNHFHWMTVTGHQMDYALARSLDPILGLVVERDANGNPITDTNGNPKVVETAVGKLDEIFIKKRTRSDFSQLFVSVYKSADKEFAISIYDEPTGSAVHNDAGTARAIRMLYWLQEIYHLQDKKGDMICTLKHYTRDENNHLDETETAGILEYGGTIIKDGKTLYAVTCTHEIGNGGLVGYFTKDGEIYLLDNNGNPYFYKS